MRKTKAGITIYEDNDKAPTANNATEQCQIMINMLRKVINKMAEVIDDLQSQIDELKNK